MIIQPTAGTEPLRNCNMKIEVRRACREDIDGICRIESATSASPWSRESISHDIEANPNAYAAVITADETGADAAKAILDPYGSQVIAYADMWMIAGEAQLNNIAVDALYRCRGYGRMLLEHMADTGRENGCSVMTLEVRRGNAAAISLYTKAGFVQTGIRSHYYTDNGEDAVLMDRIL